MQVSISTAVQQGGSLLRLLCVLYTPLKKKALHAEKACLILLGFVPEILQVMQSVTLRAAVHSLCLSFSASHSLSPLH